jgi:hypothetical protein
MEPLRMGGHEERGQEEHWNNGHQGEPVEAPEDKEDEGRNVNESGQERLAAFGEEQDREEEKDVVVKVEVGREQERGDERGAKGDGCAAGPAADLANEVDGGGKDEDGEKYVQGEGDASGKQVRAAEVEEAVEGGHRLGIDGDDGLDVMALMSSDGG